MEGRFTGFTGLTGLNAGSKIAQSRAYAVPSRHARLHARFASCDKPGRCDCRARDLIAPRRAQTISHLWVPRKTRRETRQIDRSQRFPKRLIKTPKNRTRSRLSGSIEHGSLLRSRRQILSRWLRPDRGAYGVEIAVIRAEVETVPSAPVAGAAPSPPVANMRVIAIQ